MSFELYICKSNSHHRTSVTSFVVSYIASSEPPQGETGGRVVATVSGERVDTSDASRVCVWYTFWSLEIATEKACIVRMF